MKHCFGIVLFGVHSFYILNVVIVGAVVLSLLIILWERLHRVLVCVLNYRSIFIGSWFCVFVFVCLFVFCLIVFLLLFFLFVFFLGGEILFFIYRIAFIKS